MHDAKGILFGILRNIFFRRHFSGASKRDCLLYYCATYSEKVGEAFFSGNKTVIEMIFLLCMLILNCRMFFCLIIIILLIKQLSSFYYFIRILLAAIPVCKGNTFHILQRMGIYHIFATLDRCRPLKKVMTV